MLTNFVKSFFCSLLSPIVSKYLAAGITKFLLNLLLTDLSLLLVDGHRHVFDSLIAVFFALGAILVDGSTRLEDESADVHVPVVVDLLDVAGSMKS